MDDHLIPYAGKTTRPAGFREGNDNPRIAITFKSAQFDAVCAYASRRGVSFAQATRELVAAGLARLSG